MKKPLHLIKIGGNIIDNPLALSSFLVDFAKIDGYKILVHGGGKSATALAEQMGIPQQMVAGRRITDAETLKLITMVYGGLINKNVVAQLAACGVQTVGLSGADANTVLSVQRPRQPIDFGLVGDIKAVDATAVFKLLEAGFTPVFCALTHDGNGQLLNTNADTMAACIAAAMSRIFACSLYYCFEKKGVLEDVNNENSVISTLTPQLYEQLKAQHRIFEGMIPKLDNAFNTLKNGVEEVVVIRAEDILKRVFNKENYGTRIVGE